MSEVKVNKISPRSGTGVQLGDSGDTITIPAGANATLGGAGSTISIPAGATITNSGTAAGFGATGAASWETTVKTSTFTAVSGVGYFVNTTGGAVTVNLPAGVAGAVVAIKDYANTFDTNAVTVSPNGSDKIGGLAIDSILSTEGLAVTLVFIDSTQGWLVTDSGLQSEAPGPQYVVASGGNTTLTVCSHKVHIFTGPGTLCVSAAGNSAGSNSIEYLVVAGSAGGTSDWAGGSGAGGWRSYSALPSAHPLNAPAALPVSVQGYPITVGGAGSVGGRNELGGNGSSSVFSTITSAGGGRAGNEGNNSVGAAGGSGGGGGTGGGPGCGCGGAGNTPPTNPAQGSSGGNNSSNTTGYTAGGGGAGGTGEGCGSGSVPGGAGGVGAYVVDGFIGPTAPSYGTPGPVGSTRYFSGGGGGAAGSSPRTGGAGGAGGGGAGAVGPAIGTAGTVNTGGGGGGGSGNESPNPGSGGGSGIVMIRYKFQT
tara:strand:+ start:515 stop:1957 length:1443 start_codon:yes stop_codon:yes gene_type:complete